VFGVLQVFWGFNPQNGGQEKCLDGHLLNLPYTAVAALISAFSNQSVTFWFDSIPSIKRSSSGVIALATVGQLHAT
jgi:hypothetical protein